MLFCHSDKCLQHGKTRIGAFLRMELTGKQVILLHRGVDLHPILCGSGHNPLLLGLQIIGMYKIDISMSVNAFE